MEQFLTTDFFEIEKESLISPFTRPCPFCNGTGKMPDDIED